MLEVVAAGREVAARGLDGGDLVGVGGGVELPDLAAGVRVLGAQPGVAGSGSPPIGADLAIVSF